MVVALIGILAAIAVPALLSAKRAGNQASAIGSLRAIGSAQNAYSSSCANGMYATGLTQLATAPAGIGAAFISPDLGAADTVTKSGFIVTMAGGSDGTAAVAGACNGVPGGGLSSTYYATAEPVSVGATGTTYYWLGVAGTIFADTAPIGETDGLSIAPGGAAIQ
jgi:type II secretory pathway pseudopilin PulG